MKIISVPNETWEQEFTCERCTTVFVAEPDDLDYDSWKVSGYHFTGTAVCEMRLYVFCPSCNVRSRVDEESVPVLIMDSIKKTYREKHANLGR